MKRRRAREKEIYIGFCERWRNIPKPTLAAVQGKVIARLMLIWPCDIIIASDDAQFCGELWYGGVEFFAHPWEVAHVRPKRCSSPRTGCRLKRPSNSAW